MKAMVRVHSLTLNGQGEKALPTMELHGKRLDQTSQTNRVRDVDPLVYGSLNLREAYDVHVAGARMNASCKRPVLHALVRWPTEWEVTPETEEWMINSAVQFINEAHGGNAVFAARLDRDEEGLHTVDVFFSPRYLKETKLTRGLEKDPEVWVSPSKHGKDLALKHQDYIKSRHPKSKGILTGPRHVGIALQCELTEWLADRGVTLEPRKEKAAGPPDTVHITEWKARKQLEEVEAASQAVANDRGDLEREKADLLAEQVDIGRRQEAMLSNEVFLDWKGKDLVRMLDDGDQINRSRKAAEVEAAAVLARVKAQEADLVAAKRQADAFALGVEAWIAGDVAPVQKEGGGKSLRFRDEATQERLWRAIQPAVEQLWEWMIKVAKTVSDQAAARVGELVRAATVDRDQAAKDRVAAAAQAAAAKAEADRVAELVKAATNDRQQAAKDRVTAAALSASAKLEVAAVPELVRSAAVDREHAAKDRADAAVIKKQAGDQAVQMSRLTAAAADDRDQAATELAAAAQIRKNAGDQAVELSRLTAQAADHRDQAQAAQKALEAQLSPAAIKRAMDAKLTPERLQRAVDDLLTPQLVQDVLLEKVTIARAADSALKAALFARQQRGQGR